MRHLRRLPAVFGEQVLESGEDAEEEENEEEEEEKYLIGVLDVNVVGLQYYSGTVTSREMVCLTREPTNPYDRNAIRVDNMRGERVGHIERGKALHLAPVVDQGLAVIEGIVPHATKNRFRMPCQVYVFCKVGTAAAAQQALRGAGLTAVMGTDQTEEEDAPISSFQWASQATQLSQHAEAGGRKRKGKAEAEQKKKVEIDDVFEMLSQCHSGQEAYVTEPSPSIASIMFQHQKEALAWLVRRENSGDLPPFWEEQRQTRGGQKMVYKNTITNFSCEERPEPLRGGILADDMGLGKTLALLALILTNKPGAAPLRLAPVSQSSGSVDDEALNGDGESRPSKKRRVGSAKGSKPSTKGKNRAGGAEDTPAEVLNSLCAPASDGPRATLVICPVSVLSNWVTQLEQHTLPGSLGVHLYHGSDRQNTGGRSLSDFDIVLTTYSIVSTEGDDPKAPLQRVQWLRIILDEAHIIKTPNARQTKAVVALKAERKWAVTGTPIQNSAQDLFSFMMFLQLQPLNERSFWNRTIQRPLSKGEASGLSRLQGLMTAISLRRTKETQINGKRLVELPRKTITIHQVQLLEEDRELYDKVEWEGRQTVGRYMASGTVLQNYATVLQIILRLRQICDHSALCPEHAALLTDASGETTCPSPELLQKLLSVLQSGDEFDCPICLSPPSMAVITKCAHVYCRRCIEKSLARDKQQCPMCRSPLTVSELVTAPVEDSMDGEFVGRPKKSSAKVNALIKLLLEEKTKDPTVKSVVFSQFTQMLNHLEGPMEEAGIKYVRLDGNMSAKKRAQALAAFESRDVDTPTIFLLSLKAAGVGLNLVSACRVYMLDPWWNPAAEEQAMDRVHRLGQTRDVEVVRLIVADSIEERILQMQEKKRQLASFAFDKKSLEEKRQMRIGDVQLLMRL